MAVGEVGSIPWIGLLLGVEVTDGEDHVLGVAREEVAAARAAAGQQAVTRGVPALDLGAVGRG